MKISEAEQFQFDLNGFIVLKQVMPHSEVQEMNNCLDEIPKIDRNEWYGHIHREDYLEERGISYQQIYEAGPCFEKLIDHPVYIDYVKCFVGNQNDFDSMHSPLFIDENFAIIRGPGEAIGIHSGGHRRTKRTQFRFHNGQFHCGQINVLVPLTDIGPGDGATVVVPGSHKSNLAHPFLKEHNMKGDAGACEHGVEVYLERGDVLIFVDAICHGSARRIRSDERRVVVYRYGPSWGNFRFGYLPSKKLLAGLTPEQRKIVQPQTYRIPPNVNAGEVREAFQFTEAQTGKQRLDVENNKMV